MSNVKGQSFFVTLSDAGTVTTTHEHIEGETKFSEAVGLLRSKLRAEGLRPPTTPAALRAIAKELNVRVVNNGEGGSKVYANAALENFVAAGRTKSAVTITVNTLQTSGQNRAHRAIDSLDTSAYPEALVAAIERIVATLR